MDVVAQLQFLGMAVVVAAHHLVLLKMVQAAAAVELPAEMLK